MNAPPLTEGERWARAELERLRAARFSPRAVVAFLAASSQRSSEIRRERPALARQYRRWLLIGVGAWCAPALAGLEPFRRRFGAGLGWWSAVALMLDWHLGMLETEDGRPRPLGPADALTLGRAWLVPVVADDLRPLALLLAAGSDVLDGVAARATEPTRAGRDLEGLVDAAVLAAALSAGHRAHRLARSAIALEAGRLAAGIAYALAAYFARAEAPDAVVTRAARVTTPLRMAGLLAAGAGRRRLGNALLMAGSAASLAALGRVIAPEARPRRLDRPARSARSSAPAPSPAFAHSPARR